jgi:Tol biopolymer transport system component
VKWTWLYSILFGSLLVLFIPAKYTMAQFYNGHQMTFGKNRVQYNQFYWQYYRFPKFDTYFYVNGSQLAQYVAKVANEELTHIEYSLEEILQRRIVFIVYNKQSEFRQSNIGLVTGADEYNIGGVTRIVDNKVFLFFEGDHNKLRQQIRASIAQVMINEMLYGGNFRDRVSANTLLNLPEWFVPGLISYIAYDLDFETEAEIKNAVLKGNIQKIYRLHGDDAKIAGHAFWRYLSELYGDAIVSQIVYMTRISKNVETGFLYVLGMPLKNILNEWFLYHQNRYQQEVAVRDSIPRASEPIVKKVRKNRVYSQVKMSRNGKYIAYTTNVEGQYKLFLFDSQTGKTRRILRRENKLEQIVDYSYPILEWHPNGNILTYIYERQGHIWLDYYNVETKETQTREIFYLDKVLDYNFSLDGQELVFSGVEDGYTDIFVFSVVASTFKRITNDVADDLNPRFVNDSKEILFSSNRKTTQITFDKYEKIEVGENLDLFLYNYANAAPELEQLTYTWRIDEMDPEDSERDKFFYLTNQNGIFNKAFLGIDSTIAFIDTSIHYRQFTNSYPISNRSFGLSEFAYNPVTRKFAEVVKKEKRYSLFTEPIITASKPDTSEFKSTWFKKYYLDKIQYDSLWLAELNTFEVDSTFLKNLPIFLNDTVIDINFYIFEDEKKEFLDINSQAEAKKDLQLPKQMVYFTNFYSNLLVTQVDFGFMNQSYQAYTGSAFYFNPGVNILTKVGAIDLFEDYKITGGIRFSADFESNEYLVSLENLKYRLDKQYIYHRQVFESFTETEFAKIFANEIFAVYKYPFSQIHAFRTTLTTRLDQKIYKSIDDITLQKPNEHKVWGGFKGEYILDNTRSLGLNLYDGTRLKVFGEYYNQLGSGTNAHLFVVGADVRNYLPIYRGAIFASRIAYSTSFGNSLLIYYLGGVDNWMNFSANTPTFDYSTEINTDKNWVYQAVATNMRGFVQNVRNGNSFAVANFELRWPLIRFIFNRPISSDFLNNFMLVGFTDVGSAWNGFNPLNAKNAYDIEVITQKPVTVVVDRKHSPMVAGVGFGLRTRLLGYYVRTDWAWGIDGGRVLPRVFYLSLCTDF